jgi:anti-sigma-K factor RskA
MNASEKEAKLLPTDIELLLPWYAAGTLSRRDAARVEQVLANDSELTRRYEMVCEELGEVIRLNESLGAPSMHVMERLFAKIAREPARRPKTSPSLTLWLIDFTAGFSPRTLAYGAAAAVVAIVLQACILASTFVKEDAVGPRLASYEQTGNVGEGAFVLIRFNPQASAADMTRFLEENNATVVGGPLPAADSIGVRRREAAVEVRSSAPS